MSVAILVGAAASLLQLLAGLVNWVALPIAGYPYVPAARRIEQLEAQVSELRRSQPQAP